MAAVNLKKRKLLWSFQNYVNQSGALSKHFIYLFIQIERKYVYEKIWDMAFYGIKCIFATVYKCYTFVELSLSGSLISTYRYLLYSMHTKFHTIQNTTLSCMLCLIMSVIKMMVFNCLRYERNYICSKNCSSIYFQKCGTKNQYEKNKPNLETRDWLISFMAHFKVLLHPSFVFSFFIFMVTNSNQFQVFIICLIRNNSQ